MTRLITRSILFTLAAVASLAPSLSYGADGYFLTGYGPRQRALGGAGAADSRDPMAMSINPAGIVGLDREFQVGLAASLPERGYSTIGQPAVLAPGDVRSGRPIFPVPNAAYVSRSTPNPHGESPITATADSILRTTSGISSLRSKLAQAARLLSLLHSAACLAAAGRDSTFNSRL